MFGDLSSVGHWLVVVGLVAVVLQPALSLPLARILRLWWRRSHIRRLWRQSRDRLREARQDVFPDWPFAQTSRPVGPAAALRPPRVPGSYLDAALVALIDVIASALVLAPADRLAIALPLGAVLVTAAVIDWRWFWLPDRITLPLALLGLVDAWTLDRLPDAAIGALLAAGLVLAIRIGYRMLRGGEGLGLGDVKFAAAMGAWLGPEQVPKAILVAAAAGIAVNALAALTRTTPFDSRSRLAFGTYLAGGFWVVWLTG